MIKKKMLMYLCKYLIIQFKKYIDNKLLYEFYNVYSKLPIINPNKYKFFLNGVRAALLSINKVIQLRVRTQISNTNCVWFSFANEHIRDIFEKSLLNPELQVILISYDSDGKKT